MKIMKCTNKEEKEKLKEKRRQHLQLQADQ
jgi:hypothetical protein